MPVARVAIRYCGCCNPQADLSWLAARVRESAAKYGFELVTAGRVDIAVLLCGCPRACAENELAAPHIVRIAGESIQGTGVSERDLPRLLEQELLRLVKLVEVGQNG